MTQTVRPPMDRKIAAILAADVVGYSRMMGQDETATVAAMQTLRAEVFGPIFARHKGEIVKSMGDGWLVEFASSVDAVTAALLVQDRLRAHPDIELRIGIHIGDITRSDGELYGDGINIAARLEALAPSGGVLISDAVYSSLDGTLSPSFVTTGPQNLKNISRVITAWVRAPEGATRAADAPQDYVASALPSLTIHPVSITDDRSEVRELAHSLSADLLTFIGGINWLTADILETAPAGNYTLKSVLRTRGDRLRLETRLNGPPNVNIWTHKSDGNLSDSFDWQDDVAAEIAGQTTDLILEAETLRLSAIPDANLEPEHCLLMGMMAWRSFSKDSFARSTEFQVRAFTANPQMADAFAEAITIVSAARTIGHMPQMEIFQEQLPSWLTAARPLAAGHAMLTLAIGVATYFEDRRAAPLSQCLEQVLRLAPFDARILTACGWAYLWAGQAQQSAACFEKSVQLGKLSPNLVGAYGGLAVACVQLGRDSDAQRYCEEGLRRADTYPTYYAAKSAALALTGQIEVAQTVMAHYRKLVPAQTLTKWQATNDYGGGTGAERYFEGLRLAGLPEE